MNRYDEIQGAARDIADWVCADPADRNRMADELIRLVSLVVKATGKGVAVAGESAMNGPDAEADAGGERYLVGEDLQRAAEEVREEATGADIERYERDGLAPAWRPDPAKRRPGVDDVARRAAEVISIMGADIRELTGQRDRYRAAWLNARARAAARRSAPVMELPEDCVCVPVPVHNDQGSFQGFEPCKHQRTGAPSSTGPFAPGELTAKAHEAADAMREQHKTPVPDERPLFAPGAEQYYRDVLGLGPKPCDAQDCPAHGDAGRMGMCVKDGVEHVWVTVEEGDPDTLLDWICNVCRTPRCPWIPGDATPGCDHSSGCTTHGLPSARKCPGAPVQSPVVLHTWVTATDGDTGATLDYVHCGVCGVRKCDGGCGDPSVGAAPDIDCTTHGNDQARQCVERCVGCGDPVDNGQAHGPSQGFGGCC